MSIPKALSDAVYKRDGFKCRHCSERRLHPHHVIFKSHGGQDVMNNLITLCPCCHLEGVHGGKLKIEVLAVLENDLVVRFVRVNGWKPR